MCFDTFKMFIQYKTIKKTPAPPSFFCWVEPDGSNQGAPQKNVPKIQAMMSSLDRSSQWQLAGLLFSELEESGVRTLVRTP